MKLLKKLLWKILIIYHRIYKTITIIIVSILASTLIYPLILKWAPVPFTPLMMIRCYEQWSSGKPIKLDYSWTPIDQISFHLQKAIISSEDPNFLRHNGFDFEAIQKAIERNRKRKKVIGGSTITQQTAKNVFLYPDRTYFRKILEAYFTVVIEFLWDKNRIYEVYLNVIELGPGVYGAEQGSLYHFKTNAKYLNLYQAETLATILPNPRKWNPNRPTNFLLKKQDFISKNMNALGNSYFKPLKEAQTKAKVQTTNTKNKKRKKTKPPITQAVQSTDAPNPVPSSSLDSNIPKSSP